MPSDFQTTRWDEQGKPYWALEGGQRYYIPPAIASQTTSDQRLQQWGQSSTGAPSASLFHDRGSWNKDTGQFDQGLNWGNILSLAVGSAIAAPFAASALTGGAAAGGGAGSTLGPTTTGSIAATTAGTAVPASLAPTAASSSGFGSLLAGFGGKPALVGAGADIAKAAIASRGSQNAARIQSEAADKSLAFQQGLYNQQQQAFAPYQQAGATAVGRLGTMAGQQGPMFQPPGPSRPPQSLGNFGMGAQSSPMAAGSQPQQGQTVMVQGPDGSKGPIPVDKVPLALARGGKVVQ